MSAADVVFKADPGNVWLDVLSGGNHWDSAGAGKTVIEVFVAGNQTVDFGGDKLKSFTARAQELAAVNRTLQLYENIINVDFMTPSTLNGADIYFAHVNNKAAEGALGAAYLPGDTTNPVTHDDQSGIIVNRDGYATNNLSSLAQGGYDFVTYIHEFGHAMGLFHPHDAPDRFPGVTAEEDDYGQFNMNQGVFTVMSYNDGFPKGPIGESPRDTFGWAGTPMALDIAALQHLYGANMAFRTGNDTYVLPSANAAGTFYACIWDAGGKDTIVNNSAQGSVIDLHAATLLRAAGGGGFVSSIDGIHGGFTIANGAVIENATGGSGADIIKGNAAANTLIGHAGNDTLSGEGGRDILNGGAGQDRMTGGAQADGFVFAATADSAVAAAQSDVITDFRHGIDTIRLAAIDAALGAAGNQAFVFRGESPAAGQLNSADVWFKRFAASETTFVYCSVDSDAAAEMAIKLEGLIALTAVDFIL